MFLRNPLRTLGIVSASFLVGVVSLLWISESPIANDELDTSSVVSNEVALKTEAQRTEAQDESEVTETLGKNAHPGFFGNAANETVIQENLPTETSTETPVVSIAKADTASAGARSAAPSASESANNSAEQQSAIQQRAEQQEAAIPENLENQNSSANKSSSRSEAKADTDLQVIEFVLANKIESREPSIVEAFSTEDEKAFAFARLSAKTTAPITFVWFREGKEHSRFTTNVQSAKQWRTFASIKLRPGNWKVQLMSGTEVLAERSFTVTVQNNAQ